MTMKMTMTKAINVTISLLQFLHHLSHIPVSSLSLFIIM